MDDEDGGILNIALSDSDTEETAAKPSRRTDQSESDFQKIRASYSVKVENGDIAKSLTLPLCPDAVKAQVQAAIYAVEELYFFRRFDEAIQLIDTLVSSSDISDRLGSGQERELLTVYKSRCEAKKSSRSHR